MRSLETICHYFAETSDQRAGAVAIEICGARDHKAITWNAYFNKVSLIATGLRDLGIAKGDKVGVISKTRAEWAFADMAILSLGAVTVPMFADATADDIEHICRDAGIKVLFVERTGILRQEKVKLALSLVPIHIFFESANTREDQITLEKLMAAAAKTKKIPAALPCADDVATIIYTSGTTGKPKGVVLTHAQLVAEVQTFKLVGMTAADRSMPFLPFAHVLGRIEVWGHAFLGYTLAFGMDPDRIKENLMLAKPTILLSVPRLFEKIHSGLLHQLEDNPVQKRAFAMAADTGRKYVRAVRKGGFISPVLKLEYAMAKNLVFKKITEKFGGQLTRAICGGAALDPQLSEFFEILGIQIYQGYGLTETSAAVTVNTPGDWNHGSVGKPIGSTEIKIADDGEILIKSAMVMAGYHNDPAATSEVLRDGWLHTGDIGFLSPGGFLTITDRKRDMIKTSNGKYVAPQKLESMLKAHNLISQVYIVGNRRKHIAALITLNREHIQSTEKARRQVQLIVHEVNDRLSEHEYIKNYTILDRDFSVEKGEITPSQKLRKNVVEEMYKAEIESLFASH